MTSHDISSSAQTTKSDSADSPAAWVRRWLLEVEHGTLCTLSTAHELQGFPVGSIVPFALDDHGRPVVLLADIAEHSRAAETDARASLFIAAPPHPSDGRADPQARWRANLAGHLVRLRHKDRAAAHAAAREALIDDDTDRTLWARYRERVPSAVDHPSAHTFHWWRLEPHRVRVIAGFGSIHWVNGPDVVRAPDRAGMAYALDHMNADHAHNLVEMVRGLGGLEVASARLVALDAGGLTVDTPERRFHFSFGKEVDAGGVRHAVIDVLKRARAATAAAGA